MVWVEAQRLVLKLRLCGACAANYYRLGDSCKACPDNSLQLLLILFVRGRVVFLRRSW